MEENDTCRDTYFAIFPFLPPAAWYAAARLALRFFGLPLEPRLLVLILMRDDPSEARLPSNTTEFPDIDFLPSAFILAAPALPKSLPARP